MVRFYSDALIALSRSTEIVNGNGTRHTAVYAEIPPQGGSRPIELRVDFYGELAEEANQRLVPGMRFSCRGIVDTDESGSPRLLAKAMCPIA